MNLFNRVSRLAVVFVSLFTFLSVPSLVQAGTDLTATCPAIGTCTVAPANTPLLDEASWIPGSSVTQRFTLSNTSSQAGFVGVEAINYAEDKSLGEVIAVEIREGSPLGPAIYSGVSLHDFRDDAFFTIDAISAGQSIDYYMIATMQPTAGNEYQAAFSQFDLNVGLEITVIPPTSGGGDGSGSSTGSGDSATGGSATPFVCNDETPTTAPSVSITNVGTNTVSLSWTSVSPVSNYALIFTRDSDGEQYGSSDIGNVTSFTVENLSGGSAYTFEVFGVNGCAPGPRGSTGSGNVPGDVIESNPIGGGQVLGEADPEPGENSENESSQDQGQVAGALDEQCQPWKFYVPWVLLVVQALFVLANEYILRKRHDVTKHFINIGITLVSIVAFYLLRNCVCFEASGTWILTFLCSWYWVVSAVESLVIRFISFAFIEEIKETITTSTK